MEPPDKLDVPQATLELMILTILAREPLHGYGVSQRLAALSGDAFRVNPGSLFPMLYRLEQDGKLKAEWGASDNNRQAKFYRVTAAGRRSSRTSRAVGPRDAARSRRAGGRMTILRRSAHGGVGWHRNGPSEQADDELRRTSTQRRRARNARACHQPRHTAGHARARRHRAVRSR